MVETRHDLDKAAKLLGRTEEACRRKLCRLGLSRRVTIEKNSKPVVAVFLQPQIDRRMEVIRQTLPRLKTLLERIDKAKEILPETISYL